ncbi:MAG: ethanolamine ammonia-lyase subunit EutB [Maribacter sp.]|uniref:ethanolamine ammonia-lyase subunit EutB n=1 Tax=Maribacter sp. TaxID=1897614 RepID=UPI0032994A62
MDKISRKTFIAQTGMLGTSLVLGQGCDFFAKPSKAAPQRGVTIAMPAEGEDIFSYIKRMYGKMDITRYRQIIGAANEFKEGDQTLGLAAKDDASRNNARSLLSQTKISDLDENVVHQDGILDLIKQSTVTKETTQNLTLGELKQFVLTKSETDIKKIMPSLSSDVIGCLVKLMSNTELISVGQKVFNPLPNSNIGSKGYLSARVQPNSPTDNTEDITWQVFNAWSYAVGDLLLGTNPVSSEPESVAKIEQSLFDIISTFNLQDTLPNCVLSHIDIQAQAEQIQPGTTGVWFQSLAGTEAANQTFDVTIEKMFFHMSKRKGRYGLYAETGQGADFTNGHGAGFDMVIHEARKYGFVRALKQEMSISKTPQEMPWVFLNDVAGFIGPEVFRTREQLVRCCLEDTIMGKLHGLTIGLDICSTLHMDVTLDDLDWCIEQILPANPAYLMALPTKNDPMLSYLTTAFNNHVKIREQFGYKVNDTMWNFFKKIKVLNAAGKPTEHFGDPIWVYYQYCLAKKDPRSKADIYAEGQQCIARIRDRGVPISEGYGEHIWDMTQELDQEVHRLYEDAKISLWTELDPKFTATIPAAAQISTQSVDRVDYVYHPESGEQLTAAAVQEVRKIKAAWADEVPDVQIIISDGLNPRALMDEGHLKPFLSGLKAGLKENSYTLSDTTIVIQHGRVRAGYACGEVLFGGVKSSRQKGIIHVIGERPGSGHHNFSAYLTVASPSTWGQQGKVDHDVSRVISGISDTALSPNQAVKDTLRVFNRLYINV